jgi:hypothetical protein
MLMKLVRIFFFWMLYLHAPAGSSITIRPHLAESNHASAMALIAKADQRLAASAEQVTSFCPRFYC